MPEHVTIFSVVIVLRNQCRTENNALSDDQRHQTPTMAQIISQGCEVFEDLFEISRTEVCPFID